MAYLFIGIASLCILILISAKFLVEMVETLKQLYDFKNNDAIRDINFKLGNLNGQLRELKQELKNLKVIRD